MRFLCLVTVLASSICLDSAQAAGFSPTENDGIFLGFKVPASQAASQETPPETPRVAGQKRARGDNFHSDLHRYPSLVTGKVPAHRAVPFDGASDSDQEIVSPLRPVSAALGLGSLSHALERLSPFSRPDSRPVVSSRTTDPRLLAIGRDDAEFVEDLAGRRADTRVLASKSADSDDKEFDLESSPLNGYVTPLTMAQVDSKLKALVAEAIAQRP